MRLQFSCQPGLWAHMKARLEVEEFPSNFTQVLVSRSQLLSIELPRIMQPHIPRLSDRIERSGKHAQRVAIAFL